MRLLDILERAFGKKFSEEKLADIELDVVLDREELPDIDLSTLKSVKEIEGEINFEAMADRSRGSFNNLESIEGGLLRDRTMKIEEVPSMASRLPDGTVLDIVGIRLTTHNVEEESNRASISISLKGVENWVNGRKRNTIDSAIKIKDVEFKVKAASEIAIVLESLQTKDVDLLEALDELKEAIRDHFLLTFYKSLSAQAGEEKAKEYELNRIAYYAGKESLYSDVILDSTTKTRYSDELLQKTKYSPIESNSLDIGSYSNYVIRRDKNSDEVVRGLYASKFSSDIKKYKKVEIGDSELLICRSKELCNSIKIPFIDREKMRDVSTAIQYLNVLSLHTISRGTKDEVNALISLLYDITDSIDNNETVDELLKITMIEKAEARGRGIAAAVEIRNTMEEQENIRLLSGFSK